MAESIQVREYGSKLDQLQHWFTEAEDSSIDARYEAERARDYVDNNSLTAAEREELRRRGQPEVKENLIREHVEWFKGLEIKQRTDPRAFPRTPQHEADAETVTECLRYVAQNCDWDTHRTAMYDSMLVEGFGGVEVVHDESGDPVVNQYPWDRLFYDPHSRKDDFSDARYKGVVLWMDYEDFKAEYPKIDVPVTAGHGSETSNQTYDDKPSNRWIDAKRHRVRVILMWYREKGEWKYCKFVWGTVIEEGVSPYVDEDGRSVCPLIMQSCHVGRELERYGIVRDMFDLQDEVNKRRSKALHLSVSRQTMGIKGAVDSVANMKRELAKPDGHIDLNAQAVEDALSRGMKPFELINTNDQITAQFSFLQEAKEQLRRYGANEALQGDAGSSASGRSVIAQQQGGLIPVAYIQDKLHRATREVYRHMWMRIKQFWTEERFVRVTDDEKSVRFVAVNRPVTLQERLEQMPQEEVLFFARQNGLFPGDPRLNAVVDIENNVTEMDVDIIIEEVPDQITLQGETFEALLKYAQAGQIPPAVLIEADPTLPTKKKERLLELLSQPPQPSPSEQLEMAGKEADVMKTQAETQKIAREAPMPLGM